jgi:hypothetical protein
LYWCITAGDEIASLELGLFLYLISDTLIAFKGMMLYCIGQVCVEILKLTYLSGRPFWIREGIKVY